VWADSAVAAATPPTVRPAAVSTAPTTSRRDGRRRGAFGCTLCEMASQVRASSAPVTLATVGAFSATRCEWLSVHVLGLSMVLSVQ